jgi:hypothetical protein
MRPILAHVTTTDIDDLVAEIDQIRGRLASTVDELIERGHPKAIASRALDDLKSKFVDETGSPRVEKIVPVVAGAAAVVAAIVVLRRLTR